MNLPMLLTAYALLLAFLCVRHAARAWTQRRRARQIARNPEAIRQQIRRLGCRRPSLD